MSVFFDQVNYYMNVYFGIQLPNNAIVIAIIIILLFLTFITFYCVPGSLLFLKI